MHLMKKITVFLICILAGLTLSISSIAEDGMNASRAEAGANKNTTSDINHNDTQAAILNISQSDHVLLLGSMSPYHARTHSRANSSFDISQRVGKVSNFTYNTDIYKPLFRANEYTRTKPAYEAPDDLASRQVYNISGYPIMKISSGIP